MLEKEYAISGKLVLKAGRTAGNPEVTLDIVDKAALEALRDFEQTFNEKFPWGRLHLFATEKEEKPNNT